jgi:hypothetical protein
MPIQDPLEKQDEALQRSLAGVGYFRRGSLVCRFTFCGKPGCAGQASLPNPHGPYDQWTRTGRGKTVTVRLTREQAGHLARWIPTGRERATDRLLRETAPASPKTLPARDRGKRGRRG